MINIVTTCSEQQWKNYGANMARSVVKHWHDAHLIVYGEAGRPDDCPNVAEWRLLPAWHSVFKSHHRYNAAAHGKGSGRYNFRFDCVRFSHKIAALVDAAERLDEGLMIWVDADTVTDKDIFPPDVERWRAGSGYISWLDRAKLYPECGFMVFECSHYYHQAFWREMRMIYERGRCFDYAQTHDSFIMWEYVKRCVKLNLIDEPHSLSGEHRDKHHVFVHSELGKYMDHFKGARKVALKSMERVK